MSEGYGTTVFSSGPPLTIGATHVNVGANSYQITSSAEVTHKGLFEVSAQPGFEAGGFTGNGMAALIIDPNRLEIASFHANGFNGVPKYDRFEIGVKLPANIQSQINSFLSSGTGLNPFNPAQVAVFCGYISPSNPTTTYYRNGFYYEDWTPISSSNWSNHYTPYSFRVRFAPPEVGLYKSYIYILVNNAVVAAVDFNLNVVAGTNPGHLRVDAGGRHKLQF